MRQPVRPQRAEVVAHTVINIVYSAPNGRREALRLKIVVIGFIAFLFHCLEYRQFGISVPKHISAVVQYVDAAVYTHVRSLGIRRLRVHCFAVYALLLKFVKERSKLYRRFLDVTVVHGIDKQQYYISHISSPEPLFNVLLPVRSLAVRLLLPPVFPLPPRLPSRGSEPPLYVFLSSERKTLV